MPIGIAKSIVKWKFSAPTDHSAIEVKIKNIKIKLSWPWPHQLLGRCSAAADEENIPTTAGNPYLLRLALSIIHLWYIYIHIEKRQRRKMNRVYTLNITC